MRKRRAYLYCMCACIVLYLYYVVGVCDYVFSRSYNDDFDYPLSIDIRPLVNEVLSGRKPSVAPINLYPYRFLTNSGKCSTLEKIDLFIVVKSAVNNFDRRNAIRMTYGQENLIPGRTIKILFFLGIGRSRVLTKKTPKGKIIDYTVEQEMVDFKDIIQMDFLDSYFNNTIKMMMSFRWLYEHCSIADFYLFTDDDIYISVKNLLNYVHNTPSASGNEMTYGKHNENDGILYAGHVFNSATPIRFLINKWRVSMEEYPWDKWPPYATAGAFVVSNRCMKMFYAGSLFVKHFRFDDVYLGIVGRKLGITPTHCSEFHFYNKKYYSVDGYRSVIASHGFGDPDELIKVWNEQNSK